MKSLTALTVFLLLASSGSAAPPPARPYHLQLEANPGAPFPFLGKFGKVRLDVYTNGVRAESMWLHGFSRNGSRTITIENPISRISADMPLTHISSATAEMSKYKSDFGVGTLGAGTPGKVGGLDATRYRLVYGPAAWIDIWTTTAIPANAQLHAIVKEFVRGISPATAALAERVPGTPLYVELNFRSYKKLPILTLKGLTFDQTGEKEALSDGTLYLKAPLPDSVWK